MTYQVQYLTSQGWWTLAYFEDKIEAMDAAELQRCNCRILEVATHSFH